MQRPNIVYIHSHDTGRYVQPYGFGLATPNLQNFAQRGVLFRQAFCANPTCSASRASLLTGTYPHVNGMIGLVNRGCEMPDYKWHLANFLAEQGYETVLSGIQHEISKERREVLGYQRFIDMPVREGQHPQEPYALGAVEYLKHAPKQPFLLTVGFGLTHRAGKWQWFHSDDKPLGDGRYVRPPLPLPDTPQTRQDFADFANAAARLDTYMGMVFDALDETGLADNTLVICTTDHGIAFPLMKSNLTDHGLGVMLMMRGPGGFAGGKVIDAMVSHIDVFPTICELAGIAPLRRLQGVSLMPLIDGRAASVREEVFAEVNYHAAYEPMRAVRTTRYKYIRRYQVLDHPVLPNCDGCVSKTLLLEHGWRQQAQEPEYLFDLVFDPNEACNLAGNPAHAATLADMRGRLDRWMRETNDPMLNGFVKAYPGMESNRLDATDHFEPRVPA